MRERIGSDNQMHPAEEEEEEEEEEDEERLIDDLNDLLDDGCPTVSENLDTGKHEHAYPLNINSNSPYSSDESETDRIQSDDENKFEINN
jgi:hypothetical protein